MDFGNGFGFWKTMPIRLRTSTGRPPGVEVLAVVEDRAVHPRVGIRSFMRLKQRMKVLLPQPDGPMKAVTKLR